MKRLSAIGVLATVLVLSAPPGADGARTHAPALPAPAPAAAGPHRIAAAATPSDERELRLGRAALLARAHDLNGVVAQLEPIDFTAPAFPGADRAAFLLAQAWLQLGDGARFDALAHVVAAWPQSSAAPRWLALEARLAHAAGGVPADSVPGLLPESERAAAATMRAAAAAMASGGDADALLARVPEGSRYTARALHLRGLLALERGDATGGEDLLRSALDVDTTYEARRELAQSLAAQDIDHERWAAALVRYTAIDHDWNAQHDALARLRASGDYRYVWLAWASRPDSSGTLVLDPAPVLAAAFAILANGAGTVPEPAAPDAPVMRVDQAPNVLRPATERWSAVAASANAVESARGTLERARWDVAHEAARLADQRRYLGLGLDSLRREDARMAPRQHLLDSLAARIDATDRQLRSVRDQEAARVARRTAALLEACARQGAWIRGLEQLYVKGPDSAQYVRAPQGFPSAAAALEAEAALASAIRALSANVAHAAPGWLATSYERSWSPRLLDRAESQAAEIGRQRQFAHVLDRSIDSSVVAARTSDELTGAQARLAAAVRTADSATSADAALRVAVAREAVERTLTAMEREREGIDYGRAAALYALAVRLGAADSAQAAATAAASPDGELEDPETAQWRAAALPALQAFLVQHPASDSRGEMRFRLADLELVAARQRFREQMAEFVRRQSGGQGAGLTVPVLDPSRALALYRRILAEDGGFAHLGAVRFNAGMILADAGDPEAGRFFAELVATAPHSAYAQEAWLRMGDMAFDGKRYAESVERYGHAAFGADPTLAVIASYKLGWAHFNQDHFEPAADAFRSVLDLYAAHRADVHVDIESEADAYLVHALAGAGGAPAFARHFDRVGECPYARHVLMALGQQYRRYGEFPDAAAADQLVLDRYPTSPEALVAAQRMVETWQRADHADRMREAQLALAPRFAPGGAWYAAQDGDSLKSAGEAFAHAAWLAVAQAQHARARASGKPDDWRAALASWQNVLAHWPHEPGAGSIRMTAGEACARLGDPAGAMRWYAEAADGANDSLAAAALVQRVATADAWYESTRGTAATGRDSLAQVVLAAGDALLERAPQHPRAADVTWRQSQLAVAHGWTERADADLEHMATRYPSDRRAPLSATQRGEVLFRANRFDEAGPAFEAALAAAQAQGRDSLVRIAQRALPVCAYRAADAAVAADSNAYAKHAERFEQVATRWPAYELAPLAQYRAGLAYARAHKLKDSARAMQVLLEEYPHCTYAGDARLQIARAFEELGDRQQAAQAYLAFSRLETDRENAAAAWLKAAELVAADGHERGADSLRLEYIRRWPADVEGAMAIMEALARRDLAGVGPGHPVSALLGRAPRAGARTAAPPVSYLADYLARAAAQPKLASRDVIAQVRFLQGEESATAFAALRLTQPLAGSVPAKKALLDTVLVRYRRTADLGVAVWAHAAAFRIGETLQGFASSLETSEPPADLAGDDLRAYRNVLAEKASVFSIRGDEVWSQLLRQQNPDSTGDAWVQQARAALSQRLARRFLFHPEVTFPVLEANGPAHAHEPDPSAATPADSAAPTSRTARAVGRREGAPR